MNAYRGRTSRYEGELTNAAGDPYVLEADDVLVLNIGYEDDDTPIIVVRSDQPTPNGSTLDITNRGSESVPAAYSVRLDNGDTSLLTEAANNVEIVLVAGSEGGDEYQINVGVLNVIGQMG